MHLFLRCLTLESRTLEPSPIDLWNLELDAYLTFDPVSRFGNRFSVNTNIKNAFWVEMMK